MSQTKEGPREVLQEKVDKSKLRTQHFGIQKSVISPQEET